VELRVRGLTREDLDQIDKLAAAHGMRRTQYVRFVLLARDHPPMTDAELHLLLAQKARSGNMRALELLAKGKPVAPSQPTRSDVQNEPFAEVIALATKKRPEGG
jgi:hypothetical protein